MTLKAVFVDCTEDLDRVLVDGGHPPPQGLVVHRGDPHPDGLAALCEGADIVLVEHTVLPPSVLERCASVRGVIFMGTGAGTYIDLEDAARRGIVVRTVPGYGDRAVAEHALALLFAGARGIVAGDRSIRAGRWHPVGGVQLLGRKLAVVGLGGIGTCMADMALALGMRVAGWNRTERDHPAFVADLDEALEGAHAVSLHLTLNPETTGILNARRLALPSRGFILVNTARAPLVEERALLDVLASGQLGHAALDVLSSEPPMAEDPFVAAWAGTTLTPHVAYMTQDAYRELWRRSLAALAELSREVSGLRGPPLKNGAPS